jgi:diguanylate cyclase (GGDEF)-like protein
MRTSPAQTLLAAARSARDGGDLAAAVAHATLAAQAAQQEHDPLTEAHALTLAAFHHARMREHEDSVRAARRALALLRSGADKVCQVEALTTLAFSTGSLGLYAEALRCCDEAVRVATELGDDRLLCWALNRSAMVYAHMHDFESCQRFFAQALEVAQRLGDREATFGLLHNHANDLAHAATLRREAGDADAAQDLSRQALSLFEQALVIAEETSNQVGLCMCLSNMAAERALLGQVAQAEQDLARAEAASGKMVWIQAMIAHNRARLLEVRGDDEAFIDTMLALHRDHPNEIRESGEDPAAGLYRALKRRGRFQEALHWCEEMVRIEREGLQQRADAQSRLLMDQMALEQAQREADQVRAALRAEMGRVAQLDAERQALAKQAQDLDHAAHVDTLTGLPNRRHLDQYLPARLNALRNTQQQLCVALLDVDHFKLINDRFGHLVGDEVLRALGRLLGTSLRDADVAARFGGEEFVLLLGADPVIAHDICERLRLAVMEREWSNLAPALAVTVSVGVGTATADDNAADVLTRVDAALYRAKREGRNRVIVASA